MSKLTIRLRKALHLHKWSTRVIWINQQLHKGCPTTMIGYQCEICGKRKIVGDRKQTIYKLLGPKTVQYLNRLGDKNEINYYD